MTKYSSDLCTDWLWRLDQTPIPPLCLELVLKDGTRYYVQCVISKDEGTKSMVISIWNLRAFSAEDLEALKVSLNKIIGSASCSRTDHEIHPKLDRANLRVHLDDVWYCIEWHNRFWPSELKKITGFTAQS